MSHWNYRVVQHSDQCAIHEVFYGDEGRPEGYTETPAFPRGENLEELKKHVMQYVRALEEPVLTAEQIGKSKT